jgi:hypothetical protein
MMMVLVVVLVLVGLVVAVGILAQDMRDKVLCFFQARRRVV